MGALLNLLFTTEQCLGSLTSRSIFYEQGLRDGAYRFFYSKKTRKSSRLQMTLKRRHFSSVILRSWSTIGLAGVWNRGFPLSRPVLIHLEVTGRRFSSAVFRYQVNLRLARQKWELVFNLQCNHPRNLSSTDYHAKVHAQENKEKAFSECASLTFIPWACKMYSLGYSMWQICRAENSLKTKIWGKHVSGATLRNWKKLVLL